MVPSKQQWKNWSLPSKLTAIGAYVGIAGLILAILMYFFPIHTFLMSPNNTVENTPIKGIEIPVRIKNSLMYDTRINPIAEYFILRTKTPTSNVNIESGTVRLQRTDDIFSVNGNYYINQGKELITSIQLPK